MAEKKYLLELKGITKIFPGVKALNNVHFQLKAGEIHALMGENGAGKSTFIKVITGVHQAEEGDIFLDGKKVHFKNPLDAQKAGIAAIYQHPTIYPQLTVTENIFMNHEKIKHGMIQWKDMNEEAEKYLGILHADFPATAEMESLSVAQQQMVEIAKALSMDARIVIMDEPTSSLTNKESEELYRVTLGLRDQGVGVIFISHRFEDMYRLASKVTVFRDAQYIGTYDVDAISNEDLVTAMVGRKIDDMFPKKEIKLGKEALRVENLNKKGMFHDISFHVKEGEILGVTGLVGAGRSEVMEALYGIYKYDSGKVFIDGEEVHIKNPKDAMLHGLGLLPENRQTEGLFLDWGIGMNIVISEIEKYGSKIFTNEKKERQIAKELAEKVDTKAVTIFDPVNSLSGGNQQKVVVAKILSSDLKIIILDEPTKGVDVGAKAEIYEIMGELAEQGYAIILVSSEMPEILGMADRVIVMCEGRITGELARGEATQETILTRAMARN